MTHPELRRSLGTTDAAVIGLGSMVGAGIFTVLAPAAAAAGAARGLLVALGIAGVVALANAVSSARLAAVYPASGGTYVYGRERLGPFWGYLAGWAFVVGKTASCAAMALTIGLYAWPEHAHAVGVGVVVALTVLSSRGVQRSATATRVVVAVVLVVLTAVVVAAVLSPSAVPLVPDGAPAPGLDLTEGAGWAGALGILQAAGLLFFAFAGYARIATLGEEVRDPARTIPRAVGIALTAALVVYATVAVAALHVLGADGLAASTAPLVDVVRTAGAGWLAPVVQVAAVLAAGGALLALLLGVSRTTLAMARDGHLPRTLAAVHPRHRVPHHAEYAVGAVVAVVVAFADVRAAIGFSSFGVLVYYAIANASAWGLPGRARSWTGTRVVPAVGLVGCLALATTLPAGAVLSGVGVLALGALFYRRR